MASKHIDNLDQVFDNHPAMDSDYVSPQRPGGVLRLPSHRSGFAAADDTASEISSNGPDSPWSPPAWRPPESSSAWYRHQPYLQGSAILRNSGRGSASIRDGSGSARHSPSLDEDTTLPANIPLPRGSESPMKEMSPEPRIMSRAGTREASPEKMDDIPERPEEEDGGPGTTGHLANYIRFSLRADVQQRTEPLEQAILWLRNAWLRMTASKVRIILTSIATLFFSMFLKVLLSAPAALPRPDLIKVASFAENFVPMIHFSEHGVRQISDLQETGTAVWDLSESVRIANLTSTPIIVSELDSLYDSLTGLATELTGFFATVDGDFDNILLVMDWARRELVHLESLPSGPMSSALGNLHAGLTAVGLLSSSNADDARNVVFASVFGMPNQQRAQITLQRTFTELLSTLENSIESELVHAQALFSLYAAIDRQFLNLNRAAAREADVQETLESEVLSSLWQRALGAKASQLRKFEKNKKLLGAVRSRTLTNKQMLVEHNHQLMALKQSLEMLRRRLVSPLLKIDERATVSGSGFGLEDQVRQLEETGERLKTVRAVQKEKVMDTLFGASKKTVRLEIDAL